MVISLYYWRFLPHWSFLDAPSGLHPRVHPIYLQVHGREVIVDIPHYVHELLILWEFHRRRHVLLLLFFIIAILFIFFVTAPSRATALLVVLIILIFFVLIFVLFVVLVFFLLFRSWSLFLYNYIKWRRKYPCLTFFEVDLFKFKIINNFRLLK